VLGGAQSLSVSVTYRVGSGDLARRPGPGSVARARAFGVKSQHVV
jgi:hypothetical protein